MARVAKTDKEPKTEMTVAQRSVKSAYEKFKKGFSGVSMDKSSYGNVPYWIDTGDMGLNRIISGDIHKGIPAGRVVLFGGKSQSGKSLICATIVGNGLNNETNPVDVVFLLDSEGGAMKNMFVAMKCDLSRIQHILVSTVEEAQLEMLKILSTIEEIQKEDPNFRAIIMLDSLGALNTFKTINDALVKDKVAGDQGARAKACNTFIKSITIPALKTMTSVLITNHVYDSPSQMFTSKVQIQGGGGGAQYMPRIVIQCETGSREKAEESKESPQQASFYTAVELKFFTVKNSFAKPYYETRVYLNFTSGKSLKYYGLFDSAIRLGFIKDLGSKRYQVPSYGPDPEQVYKPVQILKNDDLWNSFIDKFNEASIKELTYGGGVGIEVEENEEEIPAELAEIIAE